MPLDRQADVARTPAPGCPDCKHKTAHSKATWTTYHPLAGHGFIRESGWTFDRDNPPRAKVLELPVDPQ